MLYLVATPIGNLEDMTFRAVRVLKEVDLIACEDTRHSRKLLQHYGISTRLTSFFEHNERDKGEKLLVELRSGKDIALISDAGTPAISDPGYRLVRRCHEAGIGVSIVPGPQAAVSSLAVSGLPTDRFAFEGFLPARSGARRDRLTALLSEERTLVFYESPHRLAATLADLAGLCPQRDVVVVRELTKLHEEICRGSAGELAERWRTEKVRGEVVLLLAPAEPVEPELDLDSALRRELELDRPLKEVSRELAKVYGVSGSEVYARALAIRK
ncbi:16S rRNA (cytidine(1402)-2'-O)-methyltransferase [Geothermobacter hydrogeniphilus]|uniref:Ribosomal RNA small subunit methyltransferase I n=1 Tax=Geothermobacter hydrogeniphilus TaxID=1969733 RepID=A0A2K2H9W2_9BACT|nr:16S rRNA (cytidine(1402)-2'-O)-methyltransferase [Geothermobacter hydrogeniphilus]PNU20051.1 16S rRNA (cytidine(1402)-2'-O)-methyltransferase [Geothermobacter hydrogeniphilus]